MAKHNWNEITKEDVIKAIECFNNENENYPMPRSTFLLYNDKKYPAKHIRGLAYKVHFKNEISKSEFTGGLETVRFFEKLGFEVQHISKNNTTQVVTVKQESPKTSDEQKNKVNDKSNRIKIPYKEVIEQKNALQLLLNKMFDGDVVCEKTFDWMKTPTEFDNDYSKLISALCEYRGNDSFVKNNVKLRCDFVCESKKLIIEYDERQHFSQARKISLLAYPNISLHYDKNMWIQACNDIQARDNQPKDRDEVRAYYDSVRDIEAAKHGYKLVRIMHGQTDFDAPNAKEVLANSLNIVLNNTDNSNECNKEKEQSIQIGLYLQTNEYKNSRSFKKDILLVKESDIDTFVLPEYGYFPFVKEFNNSDFSKQTDIENIYAKTLELSAQVGKAIIINSNDKYGRIVSVYANAFASEGETKCKYYIKHTMTSCSAFELENYSEIIKDMFSPIFFKGLKIGMTICYDCNHSLFSRMYGLNDVDIIINSTGGDVVYDKWYKYNKARAIENGCYTFVTMGGYGAGCYVYGFSPRGKELSPCALKTRNIFVYDTASDDGITAPDTSCSQSPTINKIRDFYVSIKGIDSLIASCEKVDENLYVLRKSDSNIVFVVINGADIMKPEVILQLLYSEKLKGLKNKKYILINKWNYVDKDFYESKLSLILKVRAMENFCAVILSSNNINQCIQSGRNRTAQVVKEENGKFGLDLSRTGGPEVIWRNKEGMKACWRSNFELLINRANDK